MGLEDSGIGGGVFLDFGATSSLDRVGDLCLVPNPIDKALLAGAAGGSGLST